MKEAYKQLVEDSKLGLEEFQRKDLYKERHKDLKAVDLATRMLMVEQLKDYLENIGKYLSAEYDTIRLELVPNAMDNEKLNSPLNVAGVGRVSLTGDMYVTVRSAEPEEGVDYKANLYHWLREHELGDLIQESVNSSTLKAFVKGRIKEGKPYPSDCLKVTPFTRASITKKQK